MKTISSLVREMIALVSRWDIRCHTVSIVALSVASIFPFPVVSLRSCIRGSLCPIYCCTDRKMGVQCRMVVAVAVAVVVVMVSSSRWGSVVRHRIVVLLCSAVAAADCTECIAGIVVGIAVFVQGTLAVAVAVAVAACGWSLVWRKMSERWVGKREKKKKKREKKEKERKRMEQRGDYLNIKILQQGMMFNHLVLTWQ